MVVYLHCPYCRRRPHEIDEYVEHAELDSVTPEQFVRIEEGTYSRQHNVFTCTTCYIKIGMPLNKDLFPAYSQYHIYLKEESKGEIGNESTQIFNQADEKTTLQSGLDKTI